MLDPLLKYAEDTIKNTFKPMSKSEEAQAIVRRHVLFSLGAGLVPIPVLDIAAVTIVQLDMVRQLSLLYGKEYSENNGKAIVSSLAGSTLARLGASFMKGIPLVGSFIGGVSMAVLSGASTYALGQVFVKHFESNGELFNFDTNAFKKMYEDEFEKGKKVASKMQEEKTKTTPVTKEQADDVFSKIEKLNQMRVNGLISDEEFQSQKSKLLERL
ncbi:MAG: DUF697 domain-containing protein [Bacteroidia bacterium]|nr:DUF697 domain-containing protein [Bacteroidia bacterium]